MQTLREMRREKNLSRKKMFHAKYEVDCPAEIVSSRSISPKTTETNLYGIPIMSAFNRVCISRYSLKVQTKHLTCPKSARNIDSLWMKWLLVRYMRVPVSKSNRFVYWHVCSVETRLVSKNNFLIKTFLGFITYIQ